MSDVLSGSLLGYFDRETEGRIEQKLLTPRELVAYGRAAGELGLEMTVIAEGRDDDSKQRAAVSHGTYAERVNEYRDGLFDLASVSGVHDDLCVSYLSPVDRATEASRRLAEGDVLVEIRSETMDELRFLGHAAHLQIAAGQTPVN